MSNKEQRNIYREIILTVAALGISPSELKLRAGAGLGADATPSDWIDAAKNVGGACGRCEGSGKVVVDGGAVYALAKATQNSRNIGECYYCAGKGIANYNDVIRNIAYWNERDARSAAFVAALDAEEA